MKKTIVYLTVNLKNFKIYVGVHDICCDPNIFDHYYGDGISKKSGIPKSPTTPFARAIKKYGFESFVRFTLCVCDTRKQALDIEALIVDEEFVKREDTYNVALGGGNPPVKKKSVCQYTLDGKFVKKFESILDSAAELNIDDSAIGFAISNKTTSGGYLWSLEKVEQLDINKYHINVQKQKLYSYYKTGELHKEYDSIMNFVREFNVNLGPVQRAVKTQTTICGYYLSFEKKDRFIKEECEIKKGFPVFQYTLSGEFVGEFPSISKVIEVMGTVYNGIAASIRLGGTCGGYQ